MPVSARIRDSDNPEFCKEGSTHASASLFPLDSSPRQAAVYDQATEEWSFVNTCFGTHHLVFADDENDTLFFSVGFPAGGPVLGWLNTRLWEETGDDQLAQGRGLREDVQVSAMQDVEHAGGIDAHGGTRSHRADIVALL